MASTFKFHSQVNETVPWQAQYSFPVQATKVSKQVVKLPPKNGGTFSPGQVIRIEFPADNYLNVLNSVLSFDHTGTGGTNTRFQRGGAQNIIKRLRVMYGSLVIEDIQEYKTLVRIFQECGVQRDFAVSNGSVMEGTYATVYKESTSAITASALTTNVNIGADLMGNGKRTYCINLMSGLLTCKKLIPLKWMASQLAIEITLAAANECMLTDTAVAQTYTLEDVNFIAEMLEFDSTYDTAFFMGLSNGGVPLKFSSWHYHSFNLAGQTSVLQIHERSRSVKAAFAVIRDSQTSTSVVDSDAFYYAGDSSHSLSTGTFSAGSGSVDTFQWRVGGRYYPAQPVKARTGGAEAFVELMKTINALGDYTRASSISYDTWVSTKFIMACEFENTDVMPDTIAGINAEEQSDISLNISMLGAPSNKKADVFMHYDCLIIVKDGNVVDLVL